MTSVNIIATGPLTTVQDRGRPGYAAIGVGRAGAADRRAHDTANRLVGNTDDAATLEATMGGLRIRACGQLVVSVTGAAGPLSVDGTPDGMNCTLFIDDGQELAVGTPTSGLRTYVAVRGGFDVQPVLGSRSRDTMSDLGPPPLAAGDILAIGDSYVDWPATQLAPAPVPIHSVRVTLGPRDDWFADPAALFFQEWSVTAESNRIGIRLDGSNALKRARTDELSSEGMVPGALQVPPDGKPVLFLVDHPVTGGYPVIGVVRYGDLPQLGQLRPGDTLRFVHDASAPM